MIEQDHQLGNGGVEMKVLNVVGNFLDGLVEDLFGFGSFRAFGDFGLDLSVVVDDEIPEFAEEAGDALYVFGAPGFDGVEGAEEHFV